MSWIWWLFFFFLNGAYTTAHTHTHFIQIANFTVAPIVTLFRSRYVHRYRNDRLFMFKPRKKKRIRNKQIQNRAHINQNLTLCVWNCPINCIIIHITHSIFNKWMCLWHSCNVEISVLFNKNEWMCEHEMELVIACY